MTVGIPYDSTAYIQDAINEVLSTLTETLLIVIVVIFLFLGSFRAVLIPIVAIPVSLIGAVFLMLTFGFTINLLTLLAIVLSVGLVVDDAIVMVENVERHLQLGEKPFEAALKAARELVGPIIAMTITLAAVYAPIGIQGGLTGALFREFAFTLAGAVIVSGIVALTLSPMMSSKLLRTGDAEKGFAGWINRRFEKVRSTYGRLLAGSLKYRPVVFAMWFIVVLLMFPFYMFSAKELAPTEDQAVVFGVIQAAPNATIDQTNLFAEKVYEVYNSMPEHQSVFQITTPTGGFGGMVTKPWSERKKSTQQLQVEAIDRAVEDPRRAGDLARTAGAAGRRQLPGRLRRRVDGRAGAADGVRESARRQGLPERPLHVRGLGPQVRSAAGRPRAWSDASQSSRSGSMTSCVQRAASAAPRENSSSGRSPVTARSWFPARQSGGVVADQVDAVVRIGAVADDVAQAPDLARGRAVDVLEDGLEGVAIRVDVGEDGDLHGVRTPPTVAASALEVLALLVDLGEVLDALAGAPAAVVVLHRVDQLAHEAGREVDRETTTPGITSSSTSWSTRANVSVNS